jgi:hypothetical protein
MTIERSIFSTEDMLGAMWEMKELQPFWLKWFPTVINFETEKIEWSKIPERRRLAPLVLPTIQGKPVYGAGERLHSVQPAYVKPKDAVSPSRLLRRASGFGELGQVRPLSPKERYDAIVMDILREHRDTIMRRWEWMASRAIIHGEIILEGEGYPRTIVDFERDSSLRVVLAGNDQWSNVDADIPGQLDDWLDAMHKAYFGRPGKDIVMGPNAWKGFRKNKAVKELLNTELRGPVASIDIGIGDGTPYQFRGLFNSNLNIWTYSEWYQEPDGTVANYLDEDDVVLLASPNEIDGLQCFGSILDAEASLMPLGIFPKMWHDKDPSATIIMCQSAPMMVPVNANATLHATVR